MCFSSTTTVRPTVSNSRRAVSRWASVACFPRQMPVIPAPTWLGVLGIARTTGIGFPKSSSMKPVGTEAATEMTSCEGVTSPRISSSSSRTFCGLTAMMITSAPRTAARLSVPTDTARLAPSVCARSACRTVATALPGGRPASSRPCSRIFPILPSPRTATRCCFIARFPPARSRHRSSRPDT